MTTAAPPKPATLQAADLGNLPTALAPLTRIPHWVLWRWTLVNGRWSKPPFQVRDPHKHASTDDPSTWSDYRAAVAAVRTGRADGIGFVLTESLIFCCIDYDHGRDPASETIDDWLQNWIEKAHSTYTEITPSGTGLRTWGLTAHGTERLHTRIVLDGFRPNAAIEPYRRTSKFLTITGLAIGGNGQLGRIDRLMDQVVTWAQKHRATPVRRSVGPATNGADHGGLVSRMSVDEIEDVIHQGAGNGHDRSAVFHGVIGHLWGCGWSADEMEDELAQHPDGIGGRYLAEGRLRPEIDRCVDKYEALDLNGRGPREWAPPAQAVAPEPILPDPPPRRPPPPPPSSDDLDGDDDDDGEDVEEDELEDTPELEFDDEDPVADDHDDDFPADEGLTQGTPPGTDDDDDDDSGPSTRRRHGRGRDDDEPPEPDMSVAEEIHVEAPAFNWHAVPQEWHLWLTDAARECGCPVDYIFALLLTVSSAVFGNTRRLRARPGWVEPPHLWTMNVGWSSSGKTAGVDLFKRGLADLQADLDEPYWEPPPGVRTRAGPGEDRRRAVET
jgi:hypothetical protein